jgi:hypothetical protein
MPTTPQLIDRLVAQSGPVIPLGPPLKRALAWMALATAIVAGVVLLHGLRPDLAAQLSRPTVAAEWAASLLTGILAAIATFQISLPDRSPRWLLLPLPALAFWLATLGLGCLADWFRLGPSALALATSWSCVQAILTTSLPLGLTLLVMVRHAGLVRPGATAFVGGLGVAAFSAAGLSLFHHLDTALMVLVWHIGAVALVAGAGWGFSDRLFAWIGPARS